MFQINRAKLGSLWCELFCYRPAPPPPLSCSKVQFFKFGSVKHTQVRQSLRKFTFFAKWEKKKKLLIQSQTQSERKTRRLWKYWKFLLRLWQFWLAFTFSSAALEYYQLLLSYWPVKQQVSTFILEWVKFKNFLMIFNLRWI